MPIGTFTLGRRPVRRIGFGAMQLPGKGVFGPPRDRDEAIAVVRRAVELGVDHIDTAQYYGPDVANEILYEALAPIADSIAIVSKVGARRNDKGSWLKADRPEELRQGVEDNLRALGVERLAAVNLRILDRPEGRSPFDEQLDAMQAMRDEGLIEGIGLSNVTLEDLEHALARTEIVCVQNEFSLVNRASLPLVEACRSRGIAFVPFFPLGSAFHGVNPVLTHPAVTSAARRLGATPSQVALAWVLGFVPNVLLIPGTSSRAHLEENLGAGEVELDDEARTQLDAAG